MRTLIRMSIIGVGLILATQLTSFVGVKYARADTSSQLPPMPATSSFVGQVDDGACYPVEAPAKPSLFRWDFSGKEICGYDYLQKSLMTSVMGGGPGGDDTHEPSMITEVKGKMSLKSEGDGTARLVLEDVLVTTEHDFGPTNETNTMETQAPPTVIQGVQEDGTMRLGNSAQDLLLRMLFPIPSDPLTVGQSVSVPEAMPFHAIGSLLEVTGTSVTTLTGYVGLHGKTCARLETMIDISKVNVPEELEGIYKCQVKGKSVFFFDIQNKRFVSGRVALIMSIRVEAPMPKINLPSETKEVDLPETISMSMDNDNFISVDYVE